MRLSPAYSYYARYAAALGLFAAAMSWSAADASEILRPTAANVYLAGPNVYTEAPISGDLLAAAGRIRVDHPVGGDAVLAAGSVEVNGRIGDDLRVAGGIISVTGRIAGEALLIGGSVALGPESEVGERVWIAGNDVIVGGHAKDQVTVYGRTILIPGNVSGNVDLSGENIEILGSARIMGNITYSSNNRIKIDPGAKILGKIVRTRSSFEFHRPKLNVPRWSSFQPFFLVGLFAAGMLLIAVFPRFTQAALRAVDTSPLKSLGLGTAILFSLPPVILLLIITIIGIPIAFALLALYATALLIGYLVAAIFIGDKLLHIAHKSSTSLSGWRLGSLAAALVLLWAVRYIPYAGGLIVLIALVAGLGAIVLQAFSDYSARA